MEKRFLNSSPAITTLTDQEILQHKYTYIHTFNTGLSWIIDPKVSGPTYSTRNSIINMIKQG